MELQRRSFGRAGWLCAFWLVAAISPAAGQQAIQTNAAIQPGKGLLAVRQQIRFTRYDEDPSGSGREVEQLESLTRFSYGLTRRTALGLEVRGRMRDVSVPSGEDEDAGLGDLRFDAKYRLFQNDYGPTETARVSLIAGAELPTGTEPFDEGGLDPIVGAVYTQVHGRHGWNLAGQYTMTTSGSAAPIAPGGGSADVLRYDAAYLYRIAPARYGTDRRTTWHAVLEANGTLETNGDHELLLAPGVLFGSRDVAGEIGVQIPVAADVSNRLETDYSIVFGFRLLF